MSIICYVYGRTPGTPHMEVLPETPLPEAITVARRLLADRPECGRADLWDGDDRVATILQRGSRAA